MPIYQITNETGDPVGRYDADAARISIDDPDTAHHLQTMRDQEGGVPASYEGPAVWSAGAVANYLAVAGYDFHDASDIDAQEQRTYIQRASDAVNRYIQTSIQRSGSDGADAYGLLNRIAKSDRKPTIYIDDDRNANWTSADGRDDRMETLMEIVTQDEIDGPKPPKGKRVYAVERDELNRVASQLIADEGIDVTSPSAIAYIHEIYPHEHDLPAQMSLQNHLQQGYWELPDDYKNAPTAETEDDENAADTPGDDDPDEDA